MNIAHATLIAAVVAAIAAVFSGLKAANDLWRQHKDHGDEARRRLKLRADTISTEAMEIALGFDPTAPGLAYELRLSVREPAAALLSADRTDRPTSAREWTPSLTLHPAHGFADRRMPVAWARCLAKGPSPFERVVLQVEVFEKNSRKRV